MAFAIEIEDDNPKKPPVVRADIVSLKEELATAILNKMQDVDALQLRFCDNALSTKEKLQAIIQFKTALLIPSLKSAMGLDFSLSELKGSYNVIEILDNIENSIYRLSNYEQSEDIDFTHPKIVSSYRMLFEIIIEIMSEEIKEPVTINNIIEKVSVRCVALEQEFNKRFKNLSNKIAEFATNPLIEPFKDKDKPENVVSHLKYVVNRSCGAIGKDKTVSVLKEILTELEK